MYRKTLVTTATALAMGVSSMAWAQPMGGPNGTPGRPGPGGPPPQVQNAPQRPHAMPPPRPPGPMHHAPHHAPHHGPAWGHGHRPPPPPIAYHRPPPRPIIVGPGAGPQHNFYTGQYIPRYYRSNQYVVNDYRVHRLPPPQRGYHWVQVGADYAMIAIATGLIAQVLIGQ